VAQQISNKLKEVDSEIKGITVESAEGRIKNIQYDTLKNGLKKLSWTIISYLRIINLSRNK
jgi:hypothetical protein